MGGELAKTPLHDWHAAHGGRMVDFAGWSMPVQYGSIVDEHNATRNAVTLFDVSHMGRLDFRGDAGTLLDSLVTRRVADMAPGKIRYSLVTNEAGGVLDDVLVYRLPASDGREWRMVVNASNRQKIVDWIEGHSTGSNVSLRDLTRDTAMIAVQGPRALELLQPLVSLDLVGMKYFTGAEGTILGRTGLISRTGYTGEDGCELIAPAEHALAIWEALLTAGEPLGARPAGLACRDTLRLESAMPLYGHELTESINPIQAGLDFAVTLAGRQFIGHDAIAKFAEDKNQARRIGITLEGRRVPREGYELFAGEQRVGYVTSGTFSPTLQKPIAMAYVEPSQAAVGSKLDVDIRGQREPATIVPLPFYQRS